MSSHPLYILAFATFILVIGFAAWSYLSSHRHQQTGGRTSGIGGPNDPLGSRPTEELGKASGNPEG